MDKSYYSLSRAYPTVSDQADRMKAREKALKKLMKIKKKEIAIREKSERRDASLYQAEVAVYDSGITVKSIDRVGDKTLTTGLNYTTPDGRKVNHGLYR